MGMPTPAKAASEEYLSFAEQFAREYPEVSAGAMFGMRCLKRGGKAFLGGYADGLVVKLADADRDAAHGLPGVEAFDPSGRGRPMRNWVVLGPSLRESWDHYAAAAYRAAG